MLFPNTNLPNGGPVTISKFLPPYFILASKNRFAPFEPQSGLGVGGVGVKKTVAECMLCGEIGA